MPAHSGQMLMASIITFIVIIIILEIHVTRLLSIFYFNLEMVCITVCHDAAGRRSML